MNARIDGGTSPSRSATICNRRNERPRELPGAGIAVLMAEVCVASTGSQ